MKKRDVRAVEVCSYQDSPIGRMKPEARMAFILSHVRRVVDLKTWKRQIRETPERAADMIRDAGFCLVTSRERPDLLKSDQFLLWPLDEKESKPAERPMADPLLPPYNFNDGRLLVPDCPLTDKMIIDQLFEGDCLDILPWFPPHSVNLILCDLPYGTTQNKWDSVIPLERLWPLYRRILKPNGAVVLSAHNVFTAKLILSNEQWFKYKIVWEKSKPTNFLNAKIQPLRKHEDVCVFYNKQPTYNPQMGNGSPYDKGVRKNQLSGSYGDFQPAHVRSSGSRYPTDVVYFKTAESEGPVWHPTQKPVELGRYLVRTFTNPGDLVLDNAFGSGSFLVAAAKEDRHFVGIEKNESVHLFKKKCIDYVGVARMRLAAVKQKGVNPE